MTREDFLTEFTHLIGEAFEQEGQDFGELLVSVYNTMITAESVRPAKYEELRDVFAKYAAQSRQAYEDDEFLVSSKVMLTLQHLEESGVWKLVRRRPHDEWPDEL